MKKRSIQSGLILLLLGLAGILSTLTMDLPIPEEIKKQLLKSISLQELKYVALINPTIILIIAITIGLLCYKKAGLRMPIIEAFVERNTINEFFSSFKITVFLGLICGSLIVLISKLPVLPIEFEKLNNKAEPNIITRFLYGGFTEEIILRFGLMTFLVWLIQVVFKKTNSLSYIMAILLSALIFGIGHLPILYQLVDHPSLPMITFIIVCNTIGGIVFGWIYWKKGLEYSFLAHIVCHIILILSA